MRAMDLFCSSSASTAIISSSMDQTSMLHRSSTPRPHVHDRRKKQLPHVPCSSHLPISPRHYYEKHRKSYSSASSTKQNDESRRKSSADVYDLYRKTAAGSSRRYDLEDDVPLIEWRSESDHVSKAVAPASKIQVQNPKESPAPRINSSSSAHTREQVVVLRVSLHCKGCEGKVRKHISKMEGVTSFSIDLQTKKVTIVGDVTPLGVLASVSKVKYAQLWPSTTPSPLSSSQLSMPSSLWSSSACV